MNFSEFSEAYDESKDKKKKSSKRRKKIRRDDNPGDKNIVGQTHPYNVIGATGHNGDAPALADDRGQINNETWQEAVMFHPSEKDKTKDADRERAHKEQDDRMRYGKKGKDYADNTTLRPGEVKKWDKVNKKWVSNKD